MTSVPFGAYANRAITGLWIMLLVALACAQEESRRRSLGTRARILLPEPKRLFACAKSPLNVLLTKRSSPVYLRNLRTFSLPSDCPRAKSRPSFDKLTETDES